VLGEVVSALEAHDLVLTAEDDSLLPARDLDAITVASIFDAIRHEVPDPRRPKLRPVASADATAQQADDALRASMQGQTLRDLVRPGGAA
jgi:DNA-binding IscR family transcriptional regulator